MDPTNLTAIGDQYSLGCVMYYCLTGQYPFPDGTAVEKMMCHQHKQPASIKSLAPDTPDDLVVIVEKLMQKNPTDRYVKSAEVIDVLKAYSTGTPLVRRPSSQMKRPAVKPLTPPPNGDVELGAARPPRPAGALPKPASTPNPVAALRPSNSGKHAALQAPASAPEAAAPEQPATEPAAAPRQGIMQRLGPVGIVLLAVIAGAVAWLVSSFIK
jgi:serine/threonine protein kinase